MKHINILVQVVCLAVSLVVFGCQSGEAHAKSDSTVSSMDAMVAAVADAKAKSEAVGISLRAIVDSAKTDPATAFNTFKKDMSNLKGARDTLYSRDAALKSQGAKHLTAWETNNAAIADADLKKLADERRAEAQKSLASIDSSMAELRGALDPLYATLEDIQKYLAGDLTPAGIEAVESRAKKSSGEAKKLGDAFEKVSKSITAATQRFAVAKSAAAPADQK